MKKLVIAILIIVAIIVVYFTINSSTNVEEILSKFEFYEKDGYYDNKNNQEAAGYIVSNKTADGYKYGYVNYKGKILLEAEYNQIYRVLDVENKDEVYIIAAKNGRYGVSLNGKTIINYEYQFIDYYHKIEGFLLQKSDNYGVANIKGKIIIPIENESVEVKSKHIYVLNNGIGKVYNKEGKEDDIDFNTSFNPTENENYTIKIAEKNEQYFYGLVDKDEKELIATKYLYLEYLFDNYFIASKENNKEGIIDQKDNTKLEFKFNLVQKIQNTNLIRTLNNATNETEIYNKKFEKICTMKNANVENYQDGIKIYNNVETRYFDKNGIEINK